jgi:hypothetical protein
MHAAGQRPFAYIRGLKGKKTVTWSSNVGRWLEPGESFVDQVTVTRYYDLRQPGTYTIWVARRIQPYLAPPPGRKLRKDYVKSNVITVTVVKQAHPGAHTAR